MRNLTLLFCGDRRPWLLLLLLAVMLSVHCISEATDAPHHGRALSACQLDKVSRPARCGTFEVPENRSVANGRRLSIAVAVVPAASGRALADPIVLLMGGPGEDAISAAAIFSELLAPLLTDRDLLLVDQRGTGQSNALRCELYSPDAQSNLRDYFVPAAVERCARQLSARADLTQYTYAHFADDLEHVRRSLGYGSLNLFAGSYGTRAAQVFMRMYPQSVRTAYLGSVVPIDVPTPLTFARTTEDVFETTFAACADDARCHDAFPKLREEFRQILERLQSGEVRVAVPGHGNELRMYRGRVTEWFRSLLYRPSSAAELPWLIHRAYGGDWRPIAEGILSGTRERDSAISLGLFFAITCNEDVAFMSEEDIAQATRNTILGDYRPRQQSSACQQWPRFTLPPDYRTPVNSKVPTLFVSGDSDAGSPLWFTKYAALGFANRVEVVLQGRGHTEWSDCVAQLYERLVRTGVADKREATCEPAPRPPFKLQ